MGDTAPVRSGEGIESIDPGLKLGFTREATARLEREIAPDMAVETGVVWRGVREPFLRQDETQPFSAFTRTETHSGAKTTSSSTNISQGVVPRDFPSFRARAIASQRQRSSGAADPTTRCTINRTPR